MQSHLFAVGSPGGSLLLNSSLVWSLGDGLESAGTDETFVAAWMPIDGGGNIDEGRGTGGGGTDGGGTDGGRGTEDECVVRGSTFSVVIA